MSRKAKTRKARTQVKRQTPKAQYKVTNWREYNASLVQRGSVEVWVSEEVLQGWKPQVQGPRRRGRQAWYSDRAIECLLMLRVVFSLPLRATEGFGRSVFNVLGAEVDVPDYTTLCRRGQTLTVGLPTSARRGPVRIIVDSTGLKVYGEGEWKVRKHGYSKRRTWRKLHLSINEATQEIEVVVLTEAGVDDAQAGCQMVETLDEPLESVTGDGAYDEHKFYDTCTQRQVRQVIVPPRRSAHIWQHGNSSKPPLPRDQHLRLIRRVGRRRWKQQVGYHRRSLAETCVFRFKTIFGGQLMARHPQAQSVEARIKCKALNTMTRLGMPASVKVA
jgi:hypothetical protein